MPQFGQPRGRWFELFLRVHELQVPLFRAAEACSGVCCRGTAERSKDVWMRLPLNNSQNVFGDLACIL
eukprot:1620156-Pleurochrysis_carterae.AAC.2